MYAQVGCWLLINCYIFILLVYTLIHWNKRGFVNIMSIELKGVAKFCEQMFCSSGLASIHSGISNQGWFIGLMCAVALLTLIMLIACFVNRNKGGKYSGKDLHQMHLHQPLFSFTTRGQCPWAYQGWRETYRWTDDRLIARKNLWTELQQTYWYMKETEKKRQRECERDREGEGSLRRNKMKKMTIN